LIIERDQLRDVHWTGSTRERKVEKSPLLKAVAMERLLKTAKKGLTCVVVIYELWRLAVAL
jgi:hypothetical protein